jgi:hypothetical protein
VLTQLRIDDEWNAARGLPPRERTWEEQEILDEEPDLDERGWFVLECWSRLESERPMGMSCTGAIPYRAIRTWCRDQHLDQWNFDMMVTVITYLDSQRAERISSELAHKGA